MIAEEVNCDAIDDGELVEYELKIAAHKKCRNYDMIEAVELNYDGCLNDLKVGENDEARYVLVKKLEKESVIDAKERNVFAYRIVVRDIEKPKAIVESWKDKNKFDDLAFGNSEYGKVKVRILEVQKV